MPHAWGTMVNLAATTHFLTAAFRVKETEIR